MSINEALTAVVEGRNLDVETMRRTMHEIMSGNATSAQIAGFLVALRIKGETIDEITGAVQVMRELATGVDVSGEYLVDIVGTDRVIAGSDCGFGTFAGFGAVDPDIAYAKLQSLAEGAKLASQ